MTAFARRRRTASALIAAAAALVLTACTGTTPQLVAGPAPSRTPCGRLTLARNPWVGYDANLAVIAYLARTQLGCTVQLVTEPEAESWKHLADGSVDAIVENWGHDDLKKQYIDRQGKVVEAGLTGNHGVIGWYVPAWMTERYPEITTVEGLKKHWSLFRTAKSGGKGQFLGGDPSYVTNDEALLRNLGLNFSVVYSGSEDALIAAFRTAQADKTPMLGYFYSPQWLHAEVSLAHVTLPAYTPGCDADAKTVTCDYQPYDLDKVMSKRFATSGSPAVDLISNFSWSDADQNQVAGDIARRKLSLDAAAKAWLDTHPAVWKAWIPNAG